ncbi:MAG: HDOD domain-containing protein [Armatimonadetes bacterium]|nr:HDOD domain-containing protein [Armatimonadota bacterium]
MNTTAPTIERLVADISDLPTMPAAALAVIRETDSAVANARSISKYLVQDQSLATRVLRLSNSAYYGLTRQVSDINEAVIILGNRTVRNLAVIASSFPWLSRSFPGYGIGPAEMWKHAFGTGVAAKVVAKLNGEVDPEAAFTAGLIHNLGLVALSARLEGRSGVLVTHAKQSKATFSEIERATFGFDHCEVGSYLAEQWNLPAGLTACIRFHHAPNEATAHQNLVDCVHVGEQLVFAMDLGIPELGMLHPSSPDSLRRLGIQPDAYEQLVEECASAFADAEHAYGISAGQQRAA